MKKYLICGAMALVAGFYLTSCTHDDIGYDNLYDEKTQTFEKVFKDLYGTIDPNHDWGFTPYVDAEGDSTTTSSTRALTRGHNADANEWADPNKENGGWIVPNPLTEAQKNKVREWFQTHPNPDGVAFSHSDFFVQQVYKGGDNVGANSPEKYTAADGTTIVGSEQMDKLTCGSYSEGAETAFYYDHINNFNNGTCSWNNNVLDNGGNANNGPFHSDQIMLMVNSKSDCFGYWNSNGSVGFNNKYVIIPGDVIQSDLPGGGDDANVSGMFFVGFDYEQLIDGDVYTGSYYTFEGQQYRYLSAQMNRYCGDKKEYNDIPSADVIRDLLSKGYLPVEGKADKVFVKLDKCADGYYSDWIVRVIPGTKKSTGGGQDTQEETTTSKLFRAKRHKIMARGRVLVEDLYNANRADIDYNDAVFDAIIWYDYNVKVTRDDQGNETITPVNDNIKKYRVEMALLAAGGTIPLKIADSKFGDVHDAFGVGLTTIVNTVGEASNVFGSSVTGKNYVYKEFDFTDEIKAAVNAGKDLTLNLIPIEVEWITDNVKVAATLNNRETHTYKKDENGKLVIVNGEPEIVESEDPVVPHVLQVPIGTAWPQERVNIGLKDEGPYHLFPSYVSNKNVKFWESDYDVFYLYPDNPSPLAYSNATLYPISPVPYEYINDIGEILWEGSVDIWNYGDTKVGPQKDLFKDIQVGQKVRLYGEVINTDSGWGLQFFSGMWNNGSISGGNGMLLEAYDNNDLGYNMNGYVEFTVDDRIRRILTEETDYGVACNIQGHNFRMRHIAVVK